MVKNLFQFGPYIYSLIIVLFTFLMAMTNYDLIVGRWALDMDEQILFDGLKSIFHYDSKEQLLRFIYNGCWPNYGAIFFNLNAILCLFPKIFFGDSGVIFAGRMSGVLFLTSAFIIFTLTFLKNWALRCFCLLILINIPSVSYFMCNPKPEPIQLFFLSLFFYFFKKNNFAFARPFWILMGVSFGAKISALPFVLFVSAFAFIYNSNQKSPHHSIKQLPRTIFFTFLGLVISVPSLLPNLIFSFILFIFLKHLFIRAKARVSYLGPLLTLLTIVFNIVFCTILHKYFSLQTGASNWFISTFLSTQHPADHGSINFFSWVNYFFTEWLGGSLFFNLLFFIISSFILIGSMRHVLKNDIFDKKYYNAFTLLSSGGITLIALFMNVNRLWGFYLPLWVICITVGLFSIIETNYNYRFKLKKINVNLILSKILPLVFIFAITGLLHNWLFNNYTYYKNYSSRTKSEKFKKDHKTYLTIVDFLEKKSLERGYPITVAYDSHLPIPNKTDKFYTHRFFEPFEKWDVGYEAIILSERIKKRVLNDPDPQTFEFNQLQIEKISYKEYVILNEGDCRSDHCYKKYKDLENGGEILVLVEGKN